MAIKLLLEETQASLILHIDEPFWPCIAMHRTRLTVNVVDGGTMRLQEKTAIITGGARGIGRAIAERYVKEGARVVIADVLLDEAKQTAAAIGTQVVAVAVDVSRRESIEAMASFVADRVGAVDILVNGAAIFNMAPLSEITEEHFDRQFDINVRGLLFTTQVISAQMMACGPAVC